MSTTTAASPTHSGANTAFSSPYTSAPPTPVSAATQYRDTTLQQRRPLRRTRPSARRTVSSPWTAGASGRRLPGGRSGKAAPRLRRRRAKRNRPASGHAAVAVRAQDRAVILAGERKPGDLTKTCLRPPCRHCQWKLWNKAVADRLSPARLRPLFRPRRRRRHPSEGDGTRPPRRRRSGADPPAERRYEPHILCSMGMLGFWPPYRDRGGRLPGSCRECGARPPHFAHECPKRFARERKQAPPGRSQDGSKDPEPWDGSELAAAARARTAGASSRSAWCPLTTYPVHRWTKSSEPSHRRCRPVGPPGAGGQPPTGAQRPVAAGGQPRACGDTRHEFARGPRMGSELEGLLRSGAGRLSR